ncbi:MAG: radical SAM protein [Actinomycetota bacterium]|nr:radical SAM protein [Actinomycetota bacterium]
MSLSNLRDKIERKFFLGLMRFIAGRSARDLRALVKLLGIIIPKRYKAFAKNLSTIVDENNPQYQLYRRIMVESDPHFRDKIFENYLIQGSLLNQRKRNRENKEGHVVPVSILISPTMRCNLACVGCYASDYTKKEDLELEVIDRIINEGKEIGVALYTILGGEPFIRDDMFDIYKKHNDVFFNIFTNGTLIDENMVRKLVELGNVVPTLSIEGFKEETDQRRGKDIYEKVLASMDILKKNKIPFGYSVAVTSKNIDAITSDDFIDMMIDRGAVIGWYFLYMPIGKDPDTSLMPTPEQRLYLKERRDYIRMNKPLFIIDFWNDAPYVGGCIAGKHYIHINHRGDVEPCIFTHFAEVNIKDTSLKDALNCEFFREIRARQPYSDNLYLPCMLIDNPQVMRELYSKCKIYPTHEKATCLINNIAGEIDEYAKKVKETYTGVWEKEKNRYITKE